MSDQKSKHSRLIWGGWIFGLLTLYVCGYFALGDYANYGLFSTRTFRSGYLAEAYEPMGMIECRLRHREIIFHHPPLPGGWYEMSFEP